MAHESAGSSPTESKPESVAPSEQAESTQQTTTHKEDPSMNEVDAQQERQQEVSRGIDQGLLEEKKNA